MAYASFPNKGKKTQNDINQCGKRSRKIHLDQSCLLHQQKYCKDPQERTYKFILKTPELVSPLAAATPYVVWCIKRIKKSAFPIGPASPLTSWVSREHRELHSRHLPWALRLLPQVLQGQSFILYIWRKRCVSFYGVTVLAPIYLSPFYFEILQILKQKSPPNVKSSLY